MDKKIYGIFTICNGSSLEWSETNPILEKGELGYDSTLNQLKVGDGNSTWDQLNFVDNNDADYKELYDHVHNFNNPHRISCDQINAVPRRLNSLQNVQTTKRSKRINTFTYVSNETESGKMSLEDIKQMGTKIETTDNLETVDFEKLSQGDYIYLKK